MSQTSFPSLSRIEGCLLGGALGDALGYPLEFLNGVDLDPWVARSATRPLEFPHRRALVSDDTQMTMFSCEGLIRARRRWEDRGSCHVPTCMHGAYLRWYATQAGGPPAGFGERGWLVEDRRLHHQRAPGNSCMSALAESARNGRLPDLDNPPNDSKGCGAIMRSAPFGLVARDARWAFDEARDAAVLTHGHPTGYLTAGYFAAVVFGICRDQTLPQAMTAADQLLAGHDGAAETARIVTRVRALAAEGPPDRATIESLGGGWIAEEALAIALLCALTTSGASPADTAAAFWRAAAHDGDSDSTASLTGNLLGALHGRAALPAAWLPDLELRDLLEDLAHDLHAVFTESDALARHPYPPN